MIVVMRNHQYLDYATARRRGVSPMPALGAACAAGALLLLIAAVVVLGGMSGSEALGWISLPLGLVGLTIGVVATARRGHRTWVAVSALIVAVVYWLMIAIVLLPKLMAR